jgi:hypothetical protein
MPALESVNVGEPEAPPAPIGPPSSILELLAREASRFRPSVQREGATVIALWSREAAQTRLSAEPPVRARLASTWNGDQPSRAWAVWPGRLARLVLPGDPMTTTLADAPPISAWGLSTAEAERDVIVWPELVPVVRRGVDVLLQTAPTVPVAP